ncbi:MAG: ABC transporter permease [Clostridiales bacterium]|nr:ABC transporter permease [Clostridiales bacterium]
MKVSRIIKRNLHRNILIIIQLAIGIIILVRALSVYNYFREEVNSYEESIKQNVYDIFLIPKNNGTLSGLVNQGDVGSILSTEIATYNLVKDDTRVKVGTFSNYSFRYSISDYSKDQYLKLPTNIENIKIYGTDRELLEMYDNKIIKGQGYNEYFENNDKNEEVIPIWISDKLASYNNIGDIVEIPEFDLTEKKAKFKIIGVIDSSYPTLQKLQNGGMDSSEEEDYYVIADTKLITDRKVLSGIYIQLKEGIDPEEFQQEINSKCEETKLQMQSLESRIDRFYSFSKWNVRFIYYGIIIIVLTSFSIISIILNTILNREGEIGIRFALGARKKNIAIELCSEIIFLLLAAELVSLPFIGLIIWGSNQVIFRWWIFGIVTLMNIIIILLCIIPIFIRIFRMTPVKLINKGR